jgi:integrase
MSRIKDRRATGRGWEAVVTDGDKDWSRSFTRKADAVAFLNEQENKKLKGRYVSPAKGLVSFAVCYETCSAHAINRRASTRRTEDDFARSLLLPTFGEMAIGEIGHLVIQEWVVELNDAGYAPATICKAHQVLSRVLDHAVTNGLIEGNPCTVTTLPKIDEPDQRILSMAEIATLAAAIDERYRLWALVSAFGGTRAEESFALRAGRVDRIRPEIDIKETVVMVGAELVFHQPKTKAGKRRIELPGFVWEELVAATAALGPEDLVFSAPGGDAVRLRNFRKRFWYPATIAAGLGEKVPCARLAGKACALCLPRSAGVAGGHYVGLRIHDLRHTAVSLWIANGASPLLIKERAGHSDIAFTFRRYGHLMPQELDPTMARLDTQARAAFGLGPVASVTPIRAIS